MGSEISLSDAVASEMFRGGWGQRRGRQGETKTHQLLIGRLYFFAGSGGLKPEYTTTNSPPRGSRMIFNSHTDVEGVVRGSVVKRKLWVNKRAVVIRGGSGAEEA